MMCRDRGQGLAASHARGAQAAGEPGAQGRPPAGAGSRRLAQPPSRRPQELAPPEAPADEGFSATVDISTLGEGGDEEQGGEQVKADPDGGDKMQVDGALEPAQSEQPAPRQPARTREPPAAAAAAAAQRGCAAPSARSHCEPVWTAGLALGTAPHPRALPRSRRCGVGRHRGGAPGAGGLARAGRWLCSLADLQPGHSGAAAGLS